MGTMVYSVLWVMQDIYIYIYIHTSNRITWTLRVRLEASQGDEYPARQYDFKVEYLSNNELVLQKKASTAWALDGPLNPKPLNPKP